MTRNLAPKMEIMLLMRIFPWSNLRFELICCLDIQFDLLQRLVWCALFTPCVP
jgi:hypothetical protein